jgi:hypothetical protein
MSEGIGQVLDYLGYKNKISTLEWEERLWRQHLNGTPRDIRAAEERQRYLDLRARLNEARSVAERLHRRRNAHAPQFATQ